MDDQKKVGLKAAIERLAYLDKLTVILGTFLALTTSAILIYVFYLYSESPVASAMRQSLLYVAIALVLIIVATNIFIAFFLKKINRLIANRNEEIDMLRTVEKALIVEIDERKQFQDAVTQNEERLRKILENLPDGVVVCNSTGKITTMNSAASSISLWSMEDALGKKIGDIFQFFDPETQARKESPFRDLKESLEKGTITSNYCCINDKDKKKVRDIFGTVHG